MPVELSISDASPVAEFQRDWLNAKQVLVYPGTQHYDVAQALYILGSVTLFRRSGGSIEVEPVRGRWPGLDCYVQFFGRVQRPYRIGSSV